MSVDFKIVIETRESYRNVEQLGAAVDRTAKRVKDAGGSIQQVFDNIKAHAAALAAGWSAEKFVSEVVNIRGEFQKLEIAFKTMLGSEEKAQALMGQLVNTAAITPFDLKSVSQGAKQLLAYGVAAEDINDTLMRLGDIAAGLDIPLGDLAWLYGTTMTQGRLFARDLYQFTGRGIPLTEELAKQFGVTKDKVMGLVSAGRVGFPEVKKAIESLTNEGGKFGGLMVEQSKTITGQISNVKDKIQVAFNDIGKSSEGVINTALSGASYAVEHYEELGKVIIGLVGTYGVYKAALITINALHALQVMGIGALTAAEAAHYAALVVTNKAQKALNASILANPYAMAAVAVAAVAAAVYGYATAASGAEVAQQSFNDALERMNKSAEERQQKIKSLVDTIRNADATDLQKQLAFDELGNIAPSLTQIYDSVDKIAKADLSDFNKSLNEMGDTQHLNELQERIKTLQGLVTMLESEDIGSKSKAVGTLKGLGVDGSMWWSWADWADEARNEISLLGNEMAKIDAAKKEISTPTKLEVTYAEEEYQSAKGRLDTLSNFILAMKQEAEGRPITIPLDADATTKDTDTIIKEIEDKVEALKDEQEKNPITFTADKSKALDEYTSLLADLKDWKLNAAKGGLFTIPITIQTRLSSYQTQADSAKGYFNYVTGKYEEANAAATTYADDFLSAQKRYNNARKKRLQMESNKSAYTSKEYEDAKTEEKDAKKAYNDLGGVTMTDKQRKSAQDKANKAAEQRREAQKKIAEEIRDLERKNQDTEISIMEEGTEKKRKQIANDYEKRKDEVIKQANDFAKLNKKAGYKTATKSIDVDGTKIDGLTQKQAQNLTTSIQNAAKEKEKAENDILKAEASSMREYLKEYGTYQQQKLAIAEEYAEKIRKAQESGNIAEVMTLQREQEKANSELDMNAFKEEINWEGVFNSLDNYTIEYLKQLKKRLQEEISKSTIQPKDAQVLAEQIDAISQKISERSNEWKNTFGLTIPALEEQKRLLEEAAVAQERLTQAKQAYTEASNKVGLAKLDITTFLEKQGVSTQGKEVSSANAQDFLNMFDQGSESYQKLSSMFSNLGTAENGLANATSNLSSASSSAASSMQGAAGGMATTVAIIDTIIHKINENIQSANELIELLGAKNTGFGKGFSKFAESSQYATDAWESLKSGNVMGVAAGVVGSIKSLGGAIEEWGGFSFNGSNAKDVAEKLEELNDRNEALTKSIDLLKDSIDKDIASKALKSYDNAVEAQKTKQQNLLDAAETQAGYHDAHHSWNYYWGGFSGDTMSKINEKLGYNFNGDLWSLSPEDMEKILSIYEVRNEISESGKGGYGNAVLEKLDTYAEESGALEDLEDSINEKLNGISFDGFKDNFYSTLADMDNGVSELGDSIEDTLWQAFIENGLSEAFEDDIQALYDKMTAFNKKKAEYEEKGQTMSESEQQAWLDEIRSDKETLANEMVDYRDSMAEVFDYGGNVNQSASGNAATEITQDQADELNGRMTALQYSAEVRNELISGAVAQMVALSQSHISLTTAGNQTLNDILTQTAISNSFLEDITKYNKLMYEEWGNKLEEVRKSVVKL